jgi:hypothetical protein
MAKTSFHSQVAELQISKQPQPNLILYFLRLAICKLYFNHSCGRPVNVHRLSGFKTYRKCT